MIQEQKIDDVPSAEPGVPEVPFHCPSCGKPANGIEAGQSGLLIVFWHKPCGTVLGVQLIGLPQQARPLIDTGVPGGLPPFNPGSLNPFGGRK